MTKQEMQALKTKTILIVDDDPDAAELMQEILSMHHYQVLAVRNGLEAVEETNHHHVDLILMDIKMPYFTGFWFCDAFRKKKNTCNIPVVLVSALMDEENEAKAYEVGAVAALKKPFTMNELLAVVEKNAL